MNLAGDLGPRGRGWGTCLERALCDHVGFDRQLLLQHTCLVTCHQSVQLPVPCPQQLTRLQVGIDSEQAARLEVGHEGGAAAWPMREVYSVY